MSEVPIRWQIGQVNIGLSMKFHAPESVVLTKIKVNQETYKHCEIPHIGGFWNLAKREAGGRVYCSPQSSRYLPSSFFPPMRPPRLPDYHFQWGTTQRFGVVMIVLISAVGSHFWGTVINRYLVWYWAALKKWIFSSVYTVRVLKFLAIKSESPLYVFKHHNSQWEQ